MAARAVFVALCVFSAARATNLPAFAVIGYLPEWRFEGANFDTLARGYDALILFSAEPLADGRLSGLDRLPRAELLAEARAAATAHGCALLLCFGGNGRSSGFSAMVRSAPARKRFVRGVAELVQRMGLDGVDLNWEYPGYTMGVGYGPDSETAADYAGLAALIRELRASLEPRAVLTAAYYPDGKQEAALVAGGFMAQGLLDAALIMAYDASGSGSGADAGHSPMSLARAAIAGARRAGLPLERVALGVPFYGRLSTTGDWRTYEDLVQQHAPLDATRDAVPEGSATVHFNGRATIAAKTRLALREGLRGIMVWEAGQDCRLVPVTHGATTHVRTCPDDASSLLATVTRAIAAAAEGGNDEL